MSNASKNSRGLAFSACFSPWPSAPSMSEHAKSPAPSADELRQTGVPHCFNAVHKLSEHRYFHVQKGHSCNRLVLCISAITVASLLFQMVERAAGSPKLVSVILLPSFGPLTWAIMAALSCSNKKFHFWADRGKLLRANVPIAAHKTNARCSAVAGERSQNQSHVVRHHVSPPGGVAARLPP